MILFLIKYHKLSRKIHPKLFFLGRDPETKKYKYEIDLYYGGLKSDRVYLGKPMIYHKDNSKKQMFPNEARLKKI